MSLGDQDRERIEQCMTNVGRELVKELLVETKRKLNTVSNEEMLRPIVVSADYILDVLLTKKKQQKQ